MCAVLLQPPTQLHVGRFRRCGSLCLGVTILSVMAAPAGAVAVGCIRYDQSRLHAVAQADQPIAQACFAVELLDIQPQLPQVADGAVQPVLAAHQPHVMPHQVAHAVHVSLDQIRVGLVDQAAVIPFGTSSSVSRGTGDWARMSSAACTPHTSPSSNDVLARRLAPCTPVQLTSPTAYRLGMLV